MLCPKIFQIDAGRISVTDLCRIMVDFHGENDTVGLITPEPIYGFHYVTITNPEVAKHFTAELRRRGVNHTPLFSTDSEMRLQRAFEIFEESGTDEVTDPVLLRVPRDTHGMGTLVVVRFVRSSIRNAMRPHNHLYATLARRAQRGW